MKCLLIGSGQDAFKARDLDLTFWKVGAIHNAWSIVPEHTEYFFKSGDFIPAAGNIPTQAFLKQTRIVTYDEYDGPAQRERFGRQRYGIGATMLFNAAYWVLGNLNPDTIGFLGCSMHYPAGQANTFYGGGRPDPLRFGVAKLRKWFSYFEGFAKQQACELVNFGPPGLMPYRQGVFTA